MMRNIILLRGEIAQVDDDDYELVSQHRWRLNSNGYAATGKKNLLMHRLILDAQPGQQIDHANGDKLDNQKSNLRFCTQSQNNANRRKQAGCTSIYKGVCFNRNKRKWQAQISINNHPQNIGYFASEEEAAKAYDLTAREIFGKFAWTNLEYDPAFKMPEKKKTSSRFLGVSWNCDRRKWEAQIMVNYAHHFIGYYVDETEAARAYDAKAKEIRGDKAKLNFPDDDQTGVAC